jgi:hypothetical protein
MTGWIGTLTWALMTSEIHGMMWYMKDSSTTDRLRVAARMLG